MISPLAYVDPGAKIGKNTTVYPFAYIEKDVEIGDDCTIMPYACILNGTRMKDNNRVFHGAILGAIPQDFNYTGENTLLEIGSGNNIREYVVVNRATHPDGCTRIGNDNSIMEGVHLSHDVHVGNSCVLGYGTRVAGCCTFDDHSISSGGVILHQYCHIGSWSLIQGGCRVYKDIPPYVVIAGEPATFHSINSTILSHQNVSERVIRHMANAYRLVYQGNVSVIDALQKIEEQVPMSEEIQNIIDFVRSSKRGIIK